MITVWKRTFICLIVILLLWMIIVSLPHPGFVFRQGDRTYSNKDQFITVFPSREFQNSSHKTILLWTKYFGNFFWDFQPRVHLKDCKESRCDVTSDRNLLWKSDAVLFNTRDTEIKKLPHFRSRHQVWVLHNSEPPYYVFLDYDRFNGMFNWTSWFRLDADVFSAYGDYKKRTKENTSLPNYYASKTNFSFWTASSCTDRGRRYRLVYLLQEHMKIDTYGGCGKLVCLPKRSSICDVLFEKYKLAFALENGQCRDYVTEKFWGALSRQQIPVVWGGADYSRLAPPGSYINIKDFDSLEELASNLTRIGNSEILYNRYFKWRETYELKKHQVVDWCGLCEALHDTRRPAQVYSDIKGWVQEDSCEGYSMWDDITDKLARVFYLLGF